MLSAIAEVDSKKVILLGLSKNDIDKLANSQQPIHINSTTHAGVIPEGLDITMVYGNTEQEIYAALMKLGMVNRDTQVIEQEA